MACYRNFLVNWNFVTTPMSCASKFSSYVTMVSYFFIVIFNEFFAYPTGVTWRKLFFFVFSHDQIFVEMFFSSLFFTVFILFKNCFNQFISSIFTFKNNNWCTKTTAIAKLQGMWSWYFFWARTFITLSFV